MKALVLAGGFPQIALLQELKSRNITTVLADWNEAPVAKAYADIYYQESTLDIEAITRVAKDEQVDFVLTVCTDQALHTVAKVSEILNLPCYIDYQTALNVTNKSYMKEVFAKEGIPTAKHIILGEYDEQALSCLEYPMIVKPVDCNSSKGVVKVRNTEELKAALAQAIAFSRTKTAIAEEFVEGTELSADIYVDDGAAHVLCISASDKILDDEKFVIFRSRYSQEYAERYAEPIRIVAQQIADAFHLRDTPMLIQMIVNEKGVSVVEFSARTGGGGKHTLIKRVSGFDVIGAVVDLTLGIKPALELTPPESKYISDEFIYCYPGQFDRLVGFDEMKAEGVLTDYSLFKWKGAEFDSISSSGDRVLGFTIQANTQEEILQKHRKVVSGVSVLDPYDRDIMRHDLLPDLAWE